MNEPVRALDESGQIEDRQEDAAVRSRGAGEKGRRGEEAPLHLGSPAPLPEKQDQTEVEPESLPDPTLRLNTTWQDILWREWRNTGDEEYAEYLFKLIAEEPVGHEATVVNLLVGLAYGGLAGLLVALIGLSQAWGEGSGFLLVGIGALLGGTWELLKRMFQRRPLSTQEWLAQLTANLAPNELAILAVGLACQLLGGLAGWILGWSAGYGHTVGIMMLGLTLVVLLGTRLVGWLVSFGRQPNPKHLHRYRSLWLWWSRRPQGIEVGTALSQACRQQPATQGIWAEVLSTLTRRKQKPDPIKELIIHLQSLDWIERFTARHLLAASGGEGVAQLYPIATKITSPLRRTALRLLQDIGLETTFRLADRADDLLCPRCLAFCGAHTVSVEEGANITYYGCRICHQSRQFLEGKGVAVLDAETAGDPICQNGQVRINWLARRELFDFHAIEVVRATDEETERFAVQVGNDTDPFRRRRYKRMPCVIDPACGVSENTIRVLGSVFGKVVRS